MDAALFEEMYHAHYAELLRYGTRRVGQDAAHDVVAETFLTAWRKPKAVPVDDPLPWLYATARRVLANHLRAEARRGRLDRRIGLAAKAGVPMVVADHADGVATRTDVLRAMAELSPRDQEVLTLIEWDGLSAQTAATMLGCSQSAFKVRLHRARQRLTVALRASCLNLVKGKVP